MATYKSKYFTAEQIDEILHALYSHIKDVNGDVEIKAHDTEDPATASIYVDQGQVFMRAPGGEVSISNGKAMISGKYKSGSLPATLEFRENEAKFTGLHPQIEDRAVQNYDMDTNFLCTMKNVEQKFNNFYALRSMSDPNDTSEKRGKIYNEIDSGGNGKNLEIVVYKSEGVDVDGHAPNSGVSRISMKNTGKMDLYANTQMWFRSPDVRYNPNKFGSSQNVINRKFFDNRAIYRCILSITSCANAQEWESTIKPGQGVSFNSGDVILTICYVEDSATYQVMFGEVDNEGNYTETFVPAAQYHIYTNNVYNTSGATDSDGNNIEANNIYVVSVSDNAVTYKRVTKAYGNANNNSSGLMSAEDKVSLKNISAIINYLAKGAGVLMGSVFWNIGLQTVDTRYIDLKNISAGEKSGKISIPEASSTTKGFMSSADKKKLDGINTDGSIYRGLFEAAGAVYNPETGLYSLSGLDDLTEEQILVSYVDTMLQVGDYPMRSTRVRTFFPIPYTQDLRYWYFAASNLESIQIHGNMSVNTYSIDAFGEYCSKLKKVLDIINVENVPNTSFNIFRYSPLVEYFRIKNLKKNAVISDCPLLTLDTVSYLVDNAANTSAITVQVHPDVYAKLTDSSNTDWYAVNTAAQAKQISFATTDAQAAAISLMNAEEPAIQETRGELTEIVAPAGYYLTQAGDTDGRMYFSRKVLVEGDGIDNYRLADALEYNAWRQEEENEKQYY